MNIKRYTIYTLLIISFATYSFSLKSANDLVKEYQASMALVSDYMIRTAQAKEGQDEVLEENWIDGTLRGKESVIIKAKPESIEEKIREVFGEEWNVAQAVAMAESTLDPTRIGDRHIQRPSFGLFQINTFHNPQYDEDKLLEVEYNCNAAKELSSVGRGWRNWTTYRDGSYLQYMK